MMHGDDEAAYIDHDGLLAETDQAFLFLIDNEEIWLPKSQVTYDGSIVVVPVWLAKKKGLTSDY